jgi:hypothetical protein
MEIFLQEEGTVCTVVNLLCVGNLEKCHFPAAELDSDSMEHYKSAGLF